MRRAAISVPANIAEGFKKRGVSDKTRFLNVAQGSLEECRYHLILIEDLWDTGPRQIWRFFWKKSPS
jgi:four helix bundle protein